MTVLNNLLSGIEADLRRIQIPMPWSIIASHNTSYFSLGYLGHVLEGMSNGRQYPSISDHDFIPMISA